MWVSAGILRTPTSPTKFTRFLTRELRKASGVALPHSDFAQRSRSNGPQHTIPSSDADEEEAPDPALELSDASASSIREAKRRDAYLEPWYPEDATAEFWSQDVDDLSTTIQLSLDANRIRCRRDSDKPGPKMNPLPAKSSAKSPKEPLVK